MPKEMGVGAILRNEANGPEKRGMEPILRDEASFEGEVTRGEFAKRSQFVGELGRGSEFAERSQFVLARECGTCRG